MTDEEMKRSYEYYRQWQINKVRYRNESIAYLFMNYFIKSILKWMSWIWSSLVSRKTDYRKFE